jgi:hypothetical protein
MKTRALAVLLSITCATPAAAQINIPLPGTGSTIQIGPQQQQQEQNRSSGGASIRVFEATYGRNCRVQLGSINVTDDLTRACQGRDYCTYRVDARQLGDPSPGCAKEYSARYVCRDGGSERRASANAEANGQSVVLDCRRN